MNKFKKTIIPSLIIATILIIIATLFGSMVKNKEMIVVKEGNFKKEPIDIVLGKFQDSDCGMVINSLEFAGEIVTDDGVTRFFHDIGGLAHYLLDKKYKDSAVIWVFSKDTKRWIDGRKAWYSIDESTPMRYGFGAYENKKNGFIDYEEMSLRVARGETLRNPKIRKQVLGF